MKTFFRNLFLENWQRKALSVALAIVIWMVVNHSLTATKIVTNIPVKVINIDPGKTIEGLQSNGVLNKRLTLTLVGNKTVLDELSSNDIEVVLDATDKPNEWNVTLGKKNLVSLNPDINLSKAVSRVVYSPFSIHLTKLVTEKIPIVITHPIGEAPRDYIFLDVWPYHLTVTVSGPEEVVKRLKATGQKLTFNLSDISKEELDSLPSKGDEVSFYVPDSWKRINLPLLSDTPIEIDDSAAKALRIDFVRYNLLQLNLPLSVNLFYPPEYRDLLNPNTCTIRESETITQVNGLNLITHPLYVKGVSRLFLEIVREMLEIDIIVLPKSEQETLDWSVQFINPHLLEDRYVSMLLSDASADDVRTLQPSLRQEYLRNRFRSYMNRFTLFKSEGQELLLDISLEESHVLIKEHDLSP